MKKLSIICVFILFLGFLAGPAFPLSYEFDFDGDEVWDTEWTLNIGKTVQVEIWLDGYSCPPSDNIFLFAVFYFQYDHTKIQVNQIIPNDTKNGGPFDCESAKREDGVYTLWVNCFNSVTLTDNRILIFTLELKCIDDGSDATIKAASDLGFGGYVGKIFDCSLNELYPDDANATVHQLPDIEPTTTTMPATVPTSTSSSSSTTTTMPATVTTSTSSSSFSSSTTTKIKPTPITTTSSTSITTTTTISLLWPMVYNEIWGVKKDENLSLLRGFRDRILADNWLGRDHIFMLYNNSREILVLLTQNPSLTEETKKVVDKMLPGIQSLLDIGKMIISKKQLADLESLLTRLETKASPKLKTAIRKLKRDIDRGEIFWQLGITIS